MTTIGFELEVADNAGNVLLELQREGLTDHSGLHEYHCFCDECDPHYMSFPVKAQEDGTVEGEFITRILDYGSDEMEQVIAGVGRALVRAQAGTWNSCGAGNHVHVERPRDPATELRLLRLFARYEPELQEIAAAGHADMRGYNGRLTVNERLWYDDAIDNVERSGYFDIYNYITNGHTIAYKDSTVEFRLWNATRSAWRIRTHVGLSVAMVHAAEDGIDVAENDHRCFEEVVGPYIDAPTWGGILRQRHFKGGFAS